MFNSENRTAVLLAAYNGEEWIGEQLASLMRQTDQNFKIWVHDDGSTDRTMQIVDAWSRRFPGRICVLPGAPAGGAKSNFLYLLRQVEADYYLFCDQDDIWVETKVQKTRKAMLFMENKYSNIPLAVFSDMSVADRNGEILYSSFLDYTGRDPRRLSVKQLLRQNVAAGCTMMINRQLRELGLRYRSENNIDMHDRWFMLLAAAVGQIGFIDIPLLLYRQHGNNQIGAGRSLLFWVKEKTHNLLQGKQIQSSLYGIIVQRGMAGELAALLPAGHPDELFLQELATIGSKSKLQKMRFYKKHKLLPANLKNSWKYLIL